VNRIIVACLVAFAIVLIELMAGGTRYVFCIPSYTLLGCASLIAIFRRPDRTSKVAADAVIVTLIVFAYILWRAALSPLEYYWWADFLSGLGCLCVYLLTAFHLTGLRERRIIITALLLLAVLEILFGIRQFAGGDEWMPFGFMRAPTGRRASGSLISSIHLAGFLEAVAPFALSAAVWGGVKIGWRIALGYLAALCYFGVAITGSRGGYLSVLFSLVVFACISLFVSKRTRPRLFGRTLFITGSALLVGTVVAVTIMSSSDLLRTRLELIPKQLEKNGLDIRIYNWQAALDQFRVSPIMGTGAGTHLVYGRYFRRPQLQSDPINAHNDYLELLAEYGIIGALGMAAFLVLHIGRAFEGLLRFIRQHLRTSYGDDPLRGEALALTIGALTAVAAYIAHSVVDFNLHIPGHALIFAFIFGIMANPGSVTDGAPAKWPFLLRWALPVIALTLLLFAFPKFAGAYWAEMARVALRDDDVELALKYAAEAQQFEDRNPELYFHLGTAYRRAALADEDREAKVAHLNSSVQAYLAALAIFPQDENAMVRLAQVLGSLGRFKDAEKFYQGALALDPKLGRIHAYYARHLALVGRDKEAENRLAEGRKFAPWDDLNRIVRGTSLDPNSENK